MQKQPFASNLTWVQTWDIVSHWAGLCVQNTTGDPWDHQGHFKALDYFGSTDLPWFTLHLSHGTAAAAALGLCPFCPTWWSLWSLVPVASSPLSSSPSCSSCKACRHSTKGSRLSWHHSLGLLWATMGYYGLLWATRVLRSSHYFWTSAKVPNILLLSAYQDLLQVVSNQWHCFGTSKAILSSKAQRFFCTASSSLLNSCAPVRSSG